MTAGSGVVHSEMPSKRIFQEGGKIEGFQLWVNLPREHKMIPPRYQDLPPEAFPVFSDQEGVRGKVIAGVHRGTHAPVDTKIDIL